ncbi:AMP-binding protein [Ideonella sp. A 288]|uniref:AMP-binding protein n=1 Tax=Ideonella sp. A 288 TaxID=1962181 RepID=UPI000B4B12B9|nr:AMP-binding protein [Ideonella sp. A 288]
MTVAAAPTGHPTAARPRFWPGGLPRTLVVPEATLVDSLRANAARTPHRPAIVFGDEVLSHAELLAQVEALAGWLQQRCGVQRGDRVLLFSQNSPRFCIAYHAVMRADAVVVPVNAMSTPSELAYLAGDSGARVVLASGELVGRAAGVATLACGVVLDHATDDGAPAAFAHWPEVLQACLAPTPMTTSHDDLCVLPYTSGTTGHPKGCRHTHRTMLSSLHASRTWRGLGDDTVALSVAPMFHLLGMQNGMNLPLLAGGTLVMLPRWDREAAAVLIERHRVTYWAAPPTMVVDFFAQPGLAQRDLSSLKLLVGGGAAVPDAVSALLRDRYGLALNEAYGMTETASFLHCNPVGREKPCCLGVPTFGVDSRVVDPVTLAELPPGEVGELVTRAPQVMLGYWGRPEADAEAYVTIDGQRFLRTGDLCAADDEGYFFMRDRLKRMISVSGYKVWPAEVENQIYAHPAVHEACVIGVPDPRSGERVKALLVLKPGASAGVTAEDVIGWCRDRMAVFKAPREVAFLDHLPKSGTGKILWRELQDREPHRREPHRCEEQQGDTP